MKAKDVLRLLNITRPTLTKYVKEGKVKVDATINGQYVYNDRSVFELMRGGSSRKNVIYARVSTGKQKKDLEEQVNTISKFMSQNGVKIDEIYSEIKTGIHFDRKEFLRLLDDILKNEIDTVYVSYKDRLTRTSFGMIEKLFQSHGVRIVIISEIDNPKTNEQEFLEEIVTLIHSYSMKLYSKRRKEKLELVAKDLELEQKVPIS